MRRDKHLLGKVSDPRLGKGAGGVGSKWKYIVVALKMHQYRKLGKKNQKEIKHLQQLGSQFTQQQTLVRWKDQWRKINGARILPCVQV